MKDFLVKAKIVFDRGRNWVGYLTFLMMVFVTVGSMSQYAYFNFLQDRYWLAAVLTASFTFIIGAGYAELKIFRTYQREAEIMGGMNPIQQRMLENQKKILEKLGENR